MAIETSYSIREDLKQSLGEMAKIANMSKSKYATQLILETVKNNKLEIKTFERVTYQKRDQGIKLVALPVYLHESAYEQINNLRQLYKMSVSFILAFAIKKYLSLEKKSIITDNYVPHYVLIFKNDNHIPTFTIYWGFPGHEILYNQLE